MENIKLLLFLESNCSRSYVPTAPLYATLFFVPLVCHVEISKLNASNKQIAPHSSLKQYNKKVCPPLPGLVYERQFTNTALEMAKVFL
jgi:hypothetical protein